MLVANISSEAAIPGWQHPAPLRTWKLSSRGPHQYWAGRLPGNVWCLLPFSFFFHSFLLCFCYCIVIYSCITIEESKWYALFSIFISANYKIMMLILIYKNVKLYKIANSTLNNVNIFRFHNIYLVLYSY